MAAFLFLAAKRQDREGHRTLALTALANSGDGKEINKQLEVFERDS